MLSLPMNKEDYSQHTCSSSFRAQCLPYTPPQASLLHLHRSPSLLESFSIPSNWEDIEEGDNLDKDIPGLEY